MEFPGHVGAALVAYSPIAFVALRLGAIRLALAGALVTVALASLPDVDHYGSWTSHRGHVHTVWFAALVGAACAAAFATVGEYVLPLSVHGTFARGVFGFVVGTTSILSHLIADALTPMGVAPLSPVWRRRFSLDVTRSADPVANRRLLLLGLGTAAAAAALGVVVPPQPA